MDNIEKGFSRQDIEDKVKAIREKAENLLDKYQGRSVYMPRGERDEAEKGYVKDSRYTGFLEDLQRPLTQVEVNQILLNLQQSILQSLDEDKNPVLDARTIRNDTTHVGFGTTRNGFDEQRNLFRNVLCHDFSKASFNGELLTQYEKQRGDDYTNSMTRTLNFMNDESIDGTPTDVGLNIIRANYKGNDFNELIKKHDIKGITKIVEDLLANALPKTWGDDKDKLEIIQQYGDLTEFIECVKMHQKIYDKGFSIDLSTPSKLIDQEDLQK